MPIMKCSHNDQMVETISLTLSTVLDIKYSSHVYKVRGAPCPTLSMSAVAHGQRPLYYTAWTLHPEKYRL